jgi:predicted lipid-binding transport protein (Tim44 family)
MLSQGVEHSSIPPLFTPGVSRGFFWGRANNTMNTKGVFRFVGAGALCLALGACMSNTSSSQVGAITGALAGGLAGAALSGNLAGAITGLAIGGVAGYEIAKNK